MQVLEVLCSHLLSISQPFHYWRECVHTSYASVLGFVTTYFETSVPVHHITYLVVLDCVPVAALPCIMEMELE